MPPGQYGLDRVLLGQLCFRVILPLKRFIVRYEAYRVLARPDRER
jgi:hypothetical protein